MKFDKILVPVDFSESSRVALKHAIHFGNKLGARGVDVLHVWVPPKFLDPETKLKQEEKEETLVDFVQSQAGQSMKEFLSEMEDSGQFEVRGRLESGQPDDTILQVAAAEHYDLIIMGTLGKTGSAKLGSIAQRVVRNANCPVLTIRTPPTDKE